MKQIVVISGKGGTGKTVLTAAFASLAKSKVMADCDVDAADLHLLLNPKIVKKSIFKSGRTAVVDKNLCRNCGKCLEVCRFEAILPEFTVDPIACEGCAFCSFVCPHQAITMEENTSGEWYISDTKYGPMVHAKLGIAEENSGKLVTLVKQTARDMAEEAGKEYVIIDGSPGIGCPVIASLADADLALIVTEPTLSGMHDMKRVVDVAGHFNVKTAVVINKYDINLEVVETIEKYCSEKGMTVMGKIPFDKKVVESVVDRRPVVELEHNETIEEFVCIWEKVKASL
jgi:MinD superfamily P-loop ATPase